MAGWPLQAQDGVDRRVVDEHGQQVERVGIVGLGYVGLPLALSYAARGIHALGFDVDDSKVDALNRGESYIGHIPGTEVAEQVQAGRVSATTDFTRISEMQAVIICVPTPLSKNREPDMRYVRQTAEAIGPHIRTGQIISLESTTYPGTTKELVAPILEQKSGLTAAKDFFLCYSPEREDPANAKFSTTKVPKVVGGLSSNCAEQGLMLYRSVFDEVVMVSCAEVAEMTKLLENIFRSVNIALVNELKVLCHRMNIDVWEVIQAASTKPFGFMPFYPGPGLGGHCIPIDPFYLTWKAREHHLNTRFIELAGEVNTNMPEFVVDQVADALNSARKPLNGSKILLMGVAYKKNVDDMRESPALRIMDLLEEKGAELAYHDPYIPQLERKGHSPLGSVLLDDQAIAAHDAVVIVTDHDNLDYQNICQRAQLVIDTRNVTASIDTGDTPVFKA